MLPLSDKFYKGMGIAGMVLLLSAGYKSFYTVSESESAMVFRFGKFIGIEKSGLHLSIPFVDKILKINVEKIEEIEYKDTLLTLDENVIQASFTLQYKIYDPYSFKIKTLDAVDQLQYQAESATRAVIADFNMNDAITTRRDDVTYAIEEKLSLVLKDTLNIGIEVVALNYVSGQPPQEVKSAFDDAINAREDAESYINTAEAYKENLIPEAEGVAKKKINEARSFREQVVNRAKGDIQGFEKLRPEYEANPSLSKSRIYYDTVSDIIRKNTIIINDSGSQSMPPIQMLDLNKVIASAKAVK